MSRRKILILIICAAAVLLLGAAFFLNRSNPLVLPGAPTPQPSPTVELGEPPLVPSPVEQPEEQPQPPRYNGDFELPIIGASGYANTDITLRSAASAASEAIETLPAGTGFRILSEEGDFWQVEQGGKSGYVPHRYCMINLPDVIPSIVYDNTNAYSSQILSSGKAVPGVTGAALYENKTYNARLGREEFIMPVLYEMAKKIQAAQSAALAEGNSLKIYEAYRPHAVQRQVVEAMAELAEQDSAVRAGVSTAPWKISWFISQGTSHHQRGCAIDVSLVRADRMETAQSGPYSYDRVAEYTEYEMPTAMHELSIAAAAFAEPVSSTDDTAWRSAAPAEGMNAAARTLQRYLTGAGLTPLASEWWHFNDLASFSRVKENPGTGKFTLTEVHSRMPG